MNRTELFVAALNEVLVTRGLPRMSAYERRVMEDAFNDAVDVRVNEWWAEMHRESR